MRRHFSQREANRLAKRVRQLEDILSQQRKRWSSDWPSSVVIERVKLLEKSVAIISTARALGHAVIAVVQDDSIAFFADKLT